MTHRGPFQPLPFCDSVICTARLYKHRLNDNDLYLGEEVLKMSKTKNCRKMVKGDLSEHSLSENSLVSGNWPHVEHSPSHRKVMVNSMVSTHCTVSFPVIKVSG